MPDEGAVEHSFCEIICEIHTYNTYTYWDVQQLFGHSNFSKEKLLNMELLHVVQEKLLNMELLQRVGRFDGHRNLVGVLQEVSISTKQTKIQFRSWKRYRGRNSTTTEEVSRFQCLFPNPN